MTTKGRTERTERDCIRSAETTGSRNASSSDDSTQIQGVLSSESRRIGGKTTTRTKKEGERRNERKGERGGRQWVLWHGDATQLRPSYSRRSRRGPTAKRERTERKTEIKKGRERERGRVHERGLFTRNGPITSRDRCYLFIILLNVDR